MSRVVSQLPKNITPPPCSEYIFFIQYNECQNKYNTEPTEGERNHKKNPQLLSMPFYFIVSLEICENPTQKNVALQQMMMMIIIIII